jgi:carbonic anhydrase/acetyltransferase-like protein (isoleucine patch superfamily)
VEAVVVIIEHAGRTPRIDPSAWVAPTAVVSGAVVIGPGTAVLHGAVITASGVAELVIDSDCVVMEQAVLRATGRFSLHLGEHSLVGPHAHLSGCAIGAFGFIATGAMVFNGASLGEGCTVALGGKVHIDTELPAGTWVPMGYIAFGRPGQLYGPDRAPEVHEQLNRLGFPRYVFGVEPAGKTRPEVMTEILRKYSRALREHVDDRSIPTEP